MCLINIQSKNDSLVLISRSSEACPSKFTLRLMFSLFSCVKTGTSPAFRIKSSVSIFRCSLFILITEGISPARRLASDNSTRGDLLFLLPDFLSALPSRFSLRPFLRFPLRALKGLYVKGTNSIHTLRTKNISAGLTEILKIPGRLRRYFPASVSTSIFIGTNSIQISRISKKR